MTRARDVANVLSTATSLATDTETAAAISTHNSETTSVHGISNTANLVTKSDPIFTAIGGDEGGQINFAPAATNTTLSGNIALDIYQNRVRLFEGGGSNRGAYINLANQSNGVASEFVTANSQSGNTGKYLVTNGTTAVWQDNFTAGKNKIINGDFSVWQRGTSFTAADVYTADRWRKDSQTYSTLTRQTTSDTTNLSNIQYCARVQRNSGQTGTSSIGLIYTAETADAIRYAGQTVTVSFYARAGTNYSSASSVLNYNFYTGTGTDQSRTFSVQFTGEANIGSSNKILTTTWQRFSFTATIGATSTEWALMFYFNGIGTAGANDYFEVTGVQVEAGSTATSFQTATGTIQGELAACQRYYYKSYPQSVTPGTGVNYIGAQTANAYPSPNPTSALWVPARYPVTMRGTPAIAIYHQDGTVNAVYDVFSGGKITINSVDFISESGFWRITASTNVFTPNYPYYFHYTASAEL